MHKSQEHLANYWKQRALSAEISAKINTPTNLGKDREISTLVERLNAIENSRSWKLTAPLRRVIEKLHNIRHGTPKLDDDDQLEINDDSTLKLLQFADSTSMEHWCERLNTTPPKGRS